MRITSNNGSHRRYFVRMLAVSTVLGVAAIYCLTTYSDRPAAGTFHNPSQELKTCLWSTALVLPNVLVERGVAEQVSAERKQIDLLRKETMLLRNELEQQVTSQIASIERAVGDENIDGLFVQQQLMLSKLDAYHRVQHRVLCDMRELELQLRHCDVAFRPIARLQVAVMKQSLVAVQALIQPLARHLGTREMVPPIRVLKDREQRLQNRIELYRRDIDACEFRLAVLFAPGRRAIP